MLWHTLNTRTAKLARFWTFFTHCSAAVGHCIGSQAGTFLFVCLNENLSSVPTLYTAHRTMIDKIATAFCVATAPLGPDIQRVIWKEVQDDYTRKTLSDIWYFIREYIVDRRRYPDYMTWCDGTFSPSTINMVNTWIEFLKKRAAREIRPDITIGHGYNYQPKVVSAEKEDLWIDILNDELQTRDFIDDDIGKRQWVTNRGICLTDEETNDLFSRQYDNVTRLEALCGWYSWRLGHLILPFETQ